MILSSVYPSSPPACYRALLPRVSRCPFAIYCDLLLSFPTTCHRTTEAPDTFYSPIWPHTALRQDSGSSPDQDGFEDLYRQDFIHAISRVARCKLSRHHLDPYQCATFHRGIVRYNTGKEERDPTLELAMEYASALGTIVFDESCRLRNLTEAQIGRNQYSTDVELEWLDGEADHTAERIGALEDKEANMERSLNALLELGREQTEASTRAARGLGQLATCVLAQQNKIRAMEERMDTMREMILGLEHTAVNPIIVDEEETVVEGGSSSGEELEIEENEVAIPIPVLG